MKNQSHIPLKSYIAPVLLLIACSIHLEAQNTMATAINLGEKNASFTYTSTMNTGKRGNNYTGKTTSDVFYKFTLNKPMAVTLSHAGSALTETCIYLLDASGKLITYDYTAPGALSRSHAAIRRKLPVGVYYAVSEGYSQDGSITTSITGDASIDALVSVNIGTQSASFTCTDTQNTAGFDNLYAGGSGSDIIYKLTLSKAMRLNITHTGNSVPCTNIYLLDTSENPIAISMGTATTSVHLSRPLPAGAYYIISEKGCQPSTSGSSQDGNIVTSITGDASIDALVSVNIGSQSASFTYSNTQNTAGLDNLYAGESGSDIIYKLTLSKAMRLNITHSRGSSVPCANIYLLDADGNLIIKSMGAAAASNALVKKLPAGAYYIISEKECQLSTSGSQDGNIVTTITGDASIDALASINTGTKNASFAYSNTQNTAYLDNLYAGEGGSDIIYKLTLSKAMRLNIKHTGSSVPCANIYLLDADGNLIIKSMGAAAASNALVKKLPAGTYYIISEKGCQPSTSGSQDGNIVTSITGDASIDALVSVNTGTKNASFTYSDTQNSAYLDNLYAGEGGSDIIYKLTLSKAMSLSITHISGSVACTNIYLLDASENPIAIGMGTATTSVRLSRLLPAGTYYIISEKGCQSPTFSTGGGSQDGNIVTSITGDASIDALVSVNIGTQSASFTCTDTQNTAGFDNLYAGESGSDIIYKLTLSKAMKLNLAHSSNISSTNIYLLDASGNLIAGKQNISSAYNTLQKQLPAATYYIISEKGSATGNSSNGNITTTITGDPAIEALITVDLGIKNASFTYANTQNTAGLANLYTGQATKDAIYKFTIAQTMEVIISHCGSGVADTYLHLLDFSGTRIAYSDNYSGDGKCANTSHAYLKKTLPPGSYYAVSEGYSQDGNITTAIKGTAETPVAAQPAAGQNYIKTRTYTSDDASSFIDAVQYYDGLGRPVQHVQAGITPDRKDLVTLQEYGPMGRQSKTWLPVPGTGNNGTFYTGTIATGAKNAYNNDTCAYYETVYEKSPLSRIMKQYGPGQAWRNNGDHPVSAEYLSNNSSNPCHYYYISGNNLVKNGNYADNTLYVTKTADEDNKTAYEFKDKLNRVILQRQMDGTARHDTYFVYDDLNNLRYVLSPQASDSITANATYAPGNKYLQSYAYIYRYDGRRRRIEKELPGTDPVRYVYDKADRMIFSQDGEQALTGEWTFYKYDPMGRQILSGSWSNSGKSADDLAGQYQNVLIQETYSASGAYGYTWNTMPGVTAAMVLQASYYDSYDKFLNTLDTAAKNRVSYAAINDAAYGVRYTNSACTECSAKGLPVGTRSKILDGTDREIVTAFYYDYRARLVQQKSTNLLAGSESEYFAYSFTGDITKKRTVHTATGKTTITQAYDFYYDRCRRPTITGYRINDAAPIILSSLSYDSRGRVSAKIMHGSSIPVNYTYNIRDWIAGIKSAGLFEEYLYYSEPYGSSTRTYNGNLSAVRWISQAGATQGYRFTYDGLNRLKKAQYLLGGSANDRFTEEISEYDKNGNIRKLKRYALNSASASSPTLIDDLALSYSGNQLAKVRDAVPASASTLGIIPLQSYPASEYRYNRNGSLTADANRDITLVEYNRLNLPDKIHFYGGSHVSRTTRYTYDATGVKRRVTHTTAENLIPVQRTASASGGQTGAVTGTGTIIAGIAADTMVTDYCGSVVYENGELKYILNPEGYATKEGSYSGSNYVYSYYLKDHLGNNRAVAEISLATPKIIQATDYYPFGMPFPNSGKAPERQPYKFGGKEYDEMHGLNWYDFHARYYFGIIPVFLTPDPLAE
ncbi:MAG: DUF6443 domain-containing protein, partial [Dysgonamonadaceae bacterium]|nr:DUF6443 domain-containing protein [Dysgonamonadaceae bacterium]